jgi:hypothetical protein
MGDSFFKGGQHVTSAPAPSETEVIAFLVGLRNYRGNLSGPAQALLDSLVAAGLGRALYQTPEEQIKRLWCAYATGPYSRRSSPSSPFRSNTATWESTPWGLACQARDW